MIMIEIFIGLFVIVNIVIIISSTYWLEIKNYEITSAKLPDVFRGFKILQIADLHDKKFGKNNQRLVAKIREVNPDIIVITGDLLNHGSKKCDILDFLQELSSYPMYYISGNHELRLKHLSEEKLMKILTKYQVQVLKDKTINLEKNNESIALTGIWLDKSFYYYKGKAKQQNLKRLPTNHPLKNLNVHQFNILLAHNPRYFKDYMEAGADLVFSGHVHGGMVRLPFIGGLLSPERQFFPKYDKGVYQQDNRFMVVSSGLGSGKKFPRYLNRPELTVVTLKKKNLKS